MRMDVSSVLDRLELQERSISQLEQELAQLQSGESCHPPPEEAERLRVANEKLRYRINILKRATEKELEQASCQGDALSLPEM